MAKKLINLKDVDFSGRTVYLARYYFNAKKITYQPFKPTSIGTNTAGSRVLFGKFVGNFGSVYIRDEQVDLKPLGNWLVNEKKSIDNEIRALKDRLERLNSFCKDV